MKLIKTIPFIFFLIPVSWILAGVNNSESSLFSPELFIGCGRCDFDFIRMEIPFVTYVIDRKEADIHIMIPNQGTASEGREQILPFIGQPRFLSKNDTISYTIHKDDTWDDDRKKMVKYLKMGLVLEIRAMQDQLSLAKGETTDREILLEMRELQTQYASWLRLGQEYTFGSMCNNIVNPRI